MRRIGVLRLGAVVSVRSVAALILGTLVVESTAVMAVSAQEADEVEMPDWFDDIIPSSEAEAPEDIPVGEPGQVPLVDNGGLEALGDLEGVEVVESDGFTVDDPEAAEEEEAAVEAAADAGETEIEFPEAETWADDIGDGLSSNRAANEWGVAEPEHPVELDAHPDDPASAGSRLRVEVLDHDVAERVGAEGFVFTVDSPRGRGIEDVADGGEVPARLTVDYSGFAQAYGGDFAGRLQVVALPACAIEAAPAEGCETAGVQVPSHNDQEAGTLTVDVVDLGALVGDGLSVEAPSGSPDAAAPRSATAADDSERVAAAGDGQVVMALMAGGVSDVGNYYATPLSLSGQWSVGEGTGEFGWSYEFSVPEPVLGSAPTLGLSYSSGAVDGMVTSRNTQAPQNGVGWSDFADAFIERRYTSCFPLAGYNDLCWSSHNAVISLNGVSSELVPVNAAATEYRLKNDPGWKVERLTSSFANGDNDQEMWKVTAADGTQYFFGFGHAPGAVTESVLKVPVIGYSLGDPCHTPNAPGNPNAGDDVCDQGWRWYLDRVVDPDGNVEVRHYDREENRYGGYNGYFNNALSFDYHRSARLQEIQYGGRGWNQNYTAKVEVQSYPRCVDPGNPHLPGTNCPAPTKANASQFPDVPNDLICAANTVCTEKSPTFFSGYRYSHVLTRVVEEGDWRSVEHTNLIHGFSALEDVGFKMNLDGVQRIGIAKGAFEFMPAVEFGYTLMDNRVDYDPALVKTRMRHYRVSSVNNEFGGVTSVTYGHQNPCTPGYAVHWDDNRKDCFPQLIVTEPNGIPEPGLFHKYLVTAVNEDDVRGGSPDVQTLYFYGAGDPVDDAPYWAYSEDVAYKHPELAWAEWRGYGSFTKVVGGVERTHTRLFRGMDGDLEYAPGEGPGQIPHGQRDISVESFDGTVVEPDTRQLAGMPLEVQQGEGSSGTSVASTLTSTIHDYVTKATWSSSIPSRQAVWVGEASTTERHANDAGWRSQRTTMTYTDIGTPGDLKPPQPATVYDEGWLDVLGDEQCAQTTYASDPARWMLAYESSVTTYAGPCGGTSPVVSLVETYYDGSSTPHALPGKGKVTRSREKVDATTWNTVDSTYHPDGRLATTTDANGHTTSISYQSSTATPVAPLTDPGYPVTTTTENELSHESTVRYSARNGGPDREVDPNGRITTLEYDGLGRLLWVKEPSESAGQLHSWKFTYFVSQDKSVAPYVLTEQLQKKSPSAQYIKSWSIFDSFGRERQTQTTSPATATSELIVTTTNYDNRGRVAGQTAPQDVAGTAGTRLSYTATNRTATTYDVLGRVTKEAWFRGATEAWSTTTSYTPDTSTVTPPGAGATATEVDGLGRPVQVTEHGDGVDRTTSYGYSTLPGGGTRVTVTDPAGNATTADSNMAGWVTAQQDRDRGARTFGYDAVGNQVRTTDALGNQVHTILDGLDRPIERRSGSPTGTLLASWTYDKAGQIGLLDKSTRHTAQGNWVTEVTGYDARSRALGTKLTLPSINGLSTSYTTTQTYNEADEVTSVTHPSIGGLLQETVATTYDTIGYPDTLAGNNVYADDDYVWATGRDDIGRPLLYGYGPRPGGNTWLGKLWTYDSDQRLQRVQTSVTGTGNVSDQQIAYDSTGNVTERLRNRSGAVTRECFQYDDRNRLTFAYTVGGACNPAQAGTGAEPYSTTYAYMPNGAIDERTDNGVPTDYAYPASGPTAVRPHAPGQVGTSTYLWDGNGNMTSRNVGGVTETFSWDVEQRLAAIDGPGTDDASFVYDADGQRLLRKEGDLTTLYFGAHEVTVDGAGSVVRAVRSYTFEGQLIATRTPSGADYVVTNDQGSVEMSLPSGGTPASARAFRPFGQEYATSGSSFDSDQGFIGQIEDGQSDLSYLNARYYDASIGLFISTDPVVDVGDPRMSNPYGYGFNNPTTLTDPTGMKPTENDKLRSRVRSQQKTIGKLLGVIGALKQVIRQQYSSMGDMQAVIWAQRSRIEDQRQVIGKLQGIVKHQQGVIRQQGGVIKAMRQVIRFQNRVIALFAATIKGQQATIRGQRVFILLQAAEIGRLKSARTPSAGPTSGRSQGYVDETLQERYAKLNGAHDALLAKLERKEKRISSLHSGLSDKQFEVFQLQQQIAFMKFAASLGDYGAFDLYCDAVQVVSAGQSYLDIKVTHDPATEGASDGVETVVWSANLPCAAQSLGNIMRFFGIG